MDITVTMSEEEIIEAIKNYMNDQDIITTDKCIEVNLVAGRGPNGHSAVISIKQEGAAKAIIEPAVTAPANKPGRKPKVVEAPPEPVSVTKEAEEQVSNLFAEPDITPTKVTFAKQAENVFDENEVTEDVLVDPLAKEEVESLFA